MGIYASHGVINIHTSRSYYPAAASIWFEIWGVVDPGQKISIFPGKLPKTFDFSGNFTKHRFFQANFRKNSFFQAKLAIYRYFWANYSTSLQKSSLSNILLSTTPLRLPRSPCPKSGGRDPQTPGLTPLLS